jgi:hypothetical protein
MQYIHTAALRFKRNGQDMTHPCCMHLTPSDENLNFCTVLFIVIASDSGGRGESEAGRRMLCYEVLHRMGACSELLNLVDSTWWATSHLNVISACSLKLNRK